MKKLTISILFLTSINLYAVPNMQPTMLAYYQHETSSNYANSSFSASHEDKAGKTCDAEQENISLFEDHTIYREHSHKKTFLGVDLEILKGAITFLSLGVNI